MTDTIRVHALIDALVGGGAEFLLSELAVAAPGQGIDLSVGSLKDTTGRPATVRLQERGVSPAFVPITGILNPRDLARVRRHVKVVRPQIVHTHLGNADLMGGLAARSLGIPAVSTIHADWWGGDLRARTKLHLMALVRRTCMARVIAVSDSARKAYLAEGWDRPEHIETLHNGIAAVPRPGAGPGVRAELGIPEDAFVVTMMSALRPEKGFDVAVDAVRRLAPDLPRIRLVIAGSGPFEPGVRELAASAAENVVLAGHRGDVMEVLDGSDLLIQPSRFDAFPTSLLEAMAASLPIVATGVDGILEILTPETGRLLPSPPRGDQLADAIRELAERPDERARLARAARARFADEFSAVSWARRLRELYERVLSTGAP